MGVLTFARRLRGFALSLLLTSAYLAAAQTTVTGPAGTGVVLGLAGTAYVPPILRLGASSTAIVFDLGTQDLASTAMVCVEGQRAEDVAVAVAGLGTARVLPAGTWFEVAAYPEFVVEGGRRLSGPITPTTSLSQVVCYQTFMLRLFSNASGWSLLAQLDDLPGHAPIQTIYLEARCRNELSATRRPMENGMLALQQGTAGTLLRGGQPGPCEALVAVAVKPDLLRAGESAALLTYTLISGEEGE